MRNRNMKNDKVVRAIALALSSVLASGAVMPAMTAYAAEQVTEEETAVKETKEAAEAASDVVVEVPLGFINIDIPLEKDVEVKEEVAADIIEKTDKILDKVEDVIVIKLDKSVKDDNGQVADVENDDDDSLIDDSTINELNGAQEALTEGQDIIDAAIENANTAIEAGIKTSEEAQALKEDLVKAEADAEEQLAVAEAELNDAKAELADAQAAYDEAVNVSEEAKGIAEKKLAEAQALVASAEAKAAKINNTLIAIDNLLDNADSFLSSADEKIEDKIEEAQSNLEEAMKNLDDSIGKLEGTTEDLGEKIEVLADEIKDVKEATDAFVDSVKDAYTTQKDLDALYKEYDDARKALDNAEKALEKAGIAEDDIADKSIADAKEEFAEAEANIENIKAQYEDIKKFNEKLNTDVADKNFDDATIDVVNRYIVKDGQTASFDYDSENGTYNNGAVYVVVKNEDGTVAGRYACEVTEEGTFVVCPLVTTTPDGYYTLSNGDKVEYKINAEGTKVVDENEVAVEGEGYIAFESDKVDVTSTIKETVAVKGILSTYNCEVKIKDIDVEVDGLENTKGLRYITFSGADYFLDDNNKLFSIIGSKLTGYWKSSTGVPKNYNFNSETTMKVGDYKVNVDAEGNYSYTNGKGELVTLVEKDNCFYTKTLISDSHQYDDAEKEYAMDKTYSMVENVAKELEDTEADYSNKEKAYNEAVVVLDWLEAKSEVERTDLTLAEFSVGKYEFKGDLAELPRSILDVINIDSILNMDQDSRDKTIDSLKTIVDADSSDYEKLMAFKEVVSNLGGNDADAYVALVVALGPEMTSELLVEWGVPEELVSVVNKALDRVNPATDFQKAYASAWYKALKAKVDVVLTGVELAQQAGEAVNASIEVLKASAAEGAAITDVTIDALKVAVDGIVLGGLYTGDQVVKFADAIVKNLDAYVEELQKKTAVAAKEAAEAKDAVDKLKITAPGSQELAKAWYALQQAEDKVTEFETALQKAKVDLETVKDKAAEAEEIRKKLADEEAKKNQPSAQTPANGDDNNNGGSSSSNREVAVISQGVAEQPTLATIPAGRTVRRSNGAAAPVEEVEAGEGEVEETAAPAVVEDNEVPMADKQTVTIDDNETALSASIPVEDKMSWWWLILVIIAGGTGLEMYRRHQLKKKAAAEVNND